MKYKITNKLYKNKNIMNKQNIIKKTSKSSSRYTHFSLEKSCLIILNINNIYGLIILNINNIYGYWNLIRYLKIIRWKIWCQILTLEAKI